MTNEEMIRRADKAKQLLEDGMLKEAWAAYRAALLELMASAKTDEETLEAKRQLRAADAARGHLERVIAEGAVAAADITVEAERKRARGLFDLLR